MELKLTISENLCWEILKAAEGQTVSSTWFKGHESDEPPLLHSVPQFALERQLVLKNKKGEIEDSLYFLEKRGYLIKHGFQGLTRVVFQLSDSGIAVLKSGRFTVEEQQAFQETLLDLRQPGMWGMKINIGEIFRRVKKWFS